MTPALPIDAVVAELIGALRDKGRAVLEAPPGAGKTTRVPLALLEAGLTTGRIVMLEPRRLAARAAAERMAQMLGEKAGGRVGYRIRGETKVSRETRIEVVTEGILTRMLQSDPGLEGIGAVIFDEFHERSLNADLGLALTLEVAGALRDDLLILAMSATLDTAGLADRLDAPVITSQGRAFDVRTQWLKHPLKPGDDRTRALADLVVRAECETRDRGGGLLVFLPGEREIRQAERALSARLPEYCEIRPLFGAMPFAAQRKAIEPLAGGRKVVLATAIAETSLTIEDIRVVVDGGQARRARFDPGSGMSRLVTDRITRAEAEQRRGRAGRVAEGVCYRLWTRGEEGAFDAHPLPEIEAADLSALALELALWGAEPGELPFLTQPPEGAFGEARALLQGLGALDSRSRISDHGRRLARLPLHPRLGHMLSVAGPAAAPLAALLEERDPLIGGPCDLTLRLEAISDPKRFRRRRPHDLREGAVARIRAEAQRLARLNTNQGSALSVGAMVALAYPDRIGQRRKGAAARYVLSGGKGAVLRDDDPLAGVQFLVVADSDGNPREARIRLAAAVTETEIRELFADRIEQVRICEWSKRTRRVEAREQAQLGAVLLSDQAWRDAPADAVARAMTQGVRDLGLRLTGKAARLAARSEMARLLGADLPEMREAALMAELEEWLTPFLGTVRTEAQWAAFDLLPALRARLGWDGEQRIADYVPATFRTPLGRDVAIDYETEGPAIALRVQELFGLATHPVIAGQPLKITLLSPAGRPVQVTRDLPGFWAGSYDDVRRDMRAAYPKHPWPEDPLQADPTLRAKPRKR